MGSDALGNNDYEKEMAVDFSTSIWSIRTYLSILLISTWYRACTIIYKCNNSSHSIRSLINSKIGKRNEWIDFRSEKSNNIIFVVVLYYFVRIEFYIPRRLPIEPALRLTTRFACLTNLLIRPIIVLTFAVLPLLLPYCAT